MAKISFVLLVVALVGFLHVSKAQNFNEQVLEKDLHEARNLIDEDLKEKESNLKNLETQVSMLNKSEMMLIELGEAYKNGQSLEPFGIRLKKFNRKIKQAPGEVRYVSVIQSILKDLGLNGGKDD
ncbi:unnamed protein product [Thlaspi arvense]|uniref:Uncharacterized protein n=1 Tax=Thlaspi arvense TaxID=13288 RepID=A0AAU9S6Z3_THLAR|nr:unnamed protein product [Thlaspi arvense]